MRRLLLLVLFVLCAAQAQADNEKIYNEETRRRNDEPIAALSEKLGVELVCVDGFLHARHKDNLQIITQAVPLNDLKMLVNTPIRCADGRYFPDGL